MNCVFAGFLAWLVRGRNRSRTRRQVNWTASINSYAIERRKEPQVLGTYEDTCSIDVDSCEAIVHIHQNGKRFIRVIVHLDELSYEPGEEPSQDATGQKHQYDYSRLAVLRADMYADNVMSQQILDLSLCADIVVTATEHISAAIDLLPEKERA